MKKIISFMLAGATIPALFTCNDREDYFANSNKRVKVSLESPLTACTAAYPGFIGTGYDFNIALTPEYPTAKPLPLVAQFTCKNADAFELSMGNKKYSQNDTICFNAPTKRMKLNAAKPGTYRFLIQFFKENKKDDALGKYEFTFVIGAPDLNVYIVRNGQRVEKLYDQPFFCEEEGEFTVRALSEKEELNRGRLTLAASITGAAVEVTNWRDRETKASQTDDLPSQVDFTVRYKNARPGTTRFAFTAVSPFSSFTLEDSIKVAENQPGTLTLSAAYNEDKKYYSRPQLWVDQIDSVEYLIQKDPESSLNAYRLKFEVKKDPSKIALYNTGNPELHYADRLYEKGKWYDFTDKMSGKLYYVFPSPDTYSDTLYVSLQNGTMGTPKKYKLFLSCKQSDDFNFNVTFKPALVNGYDEIKLSELAADGIKNPVVLTVSDQNPYSKFDMQLDAQYINFAQSYIKHWAIKTGSETLSNIPYNRFIGYQYGYITNTKSFTLICNPWPNDQTTATFLANTFNWVYTVKRMADGKTKTVTRQIRIVDDRMNFDIDLAAGNSRENPWQNETVTAYQLKYDSPSKDADDYTLTVTSSNQEVADVYLMNSDMSFRKATFGSAEAPPATKNPDNESNLSATDAGRMQIKGKKPGTATLSFTLRHKASGAAKTVTKTVTTRADPVEYVIEPATTIDARDKERTAIPFGGQFHAYQNPRFRIRLPKSKNYASNTTGTASVVFSTVASLTNVAKLTVKGGTPGQPGYHAGASVNYGTAVELAYDTDYFVTVAAPSAHPWNVPAGSEQWLNVKMTKATNQQTAIEAEYNNSIKYVARAYRKPNYSIAGTVTSTGGCNNTVTENKNDRVYVFDAGVVVKPATTNGAVTVTTCSGTCQSSTALSGVSWNDGHELLSGALPTSINGSYRREKYDGSEMTAINPQNPPPAPGWQNYKSVTVTSYQFNAIEVRDNWNCSSTVSVVTAPKITYSGML